MTGPLFSIADCTEGYDAHEIKGYIIHDTANKSEVHVPYPRDEITSQTLSGCAFHHGRFVMALRAAARAHEK